MAKIWIESYGCSASFADSEIISGIVSKEGHKLVNNIEDSDLNVIVTCSVKDATVGKMINRINKLKNKPLVIAGCLPKTEMKIIEKISPDASLLGPNSLINTNQVIRSTLDGRKKVELLDMDKTKSHLPKIRLNKIVGIIEIGKGCINKCTFCQTKISKGELYSYRIGDIIRQIKNEINDGCKEIWLTSTDNGCYGFDIDCNLPKLINEITKIKNSFMIRIGMMNPMHLPKICPELVDSYANKKVFKFIHVPVQSGNDEVLRHMRRGHTSKVFTDVVKKFRSSFKKCTISTDIIVGFPTESDEQFFETIKLLKETNPDIVNLSKYSRRPGTESFKLEQLSSHEIKRRSKITSELVNKISLENNKKWIGWKGKILIDEKNENGVKGRNFAYKPVFINNHYIKLGKILNIKITNCTNHCLIGSIN